MQRQPHGVLRPDRIDAASISRENVRLIPELVQLFGTSRAFRDGLAMQGTTQLLDSELDRTGRLIKPKFGELEANQLGRDS